MYVYDHMLTFSDEVDRIWSQRFSFATLLFYLNRYLTHAQFIILQVAFYEKNWSLSVCERYVKFPGATTLCVVAVAELIMILRVYALYSANRVILGVLLVVLAAQVALMGLAVSTGVRVPLPLSFPGCVLTGEAKLFAIFWAAPLFTDSCIFLLTLFRLKTYLADRVKMPMMDLLLRDGILYFVAIFSVNLMNTLIYFLAVDDLKALGASFSQIITSIMIARLQLNLRGQRRAVVADTAAASNGVGQWNHQPRKPTPSQFVSFVENGDSGRFFTIGNLGNPVAAWGDDEKHNEKSKDIALVQYRAPAPAPVAQQQPTYTPTYTVERIPHPYYPS